MSNSKANAIEAIFEIAEALTIKIESLPIEVLPDFLTEQSSGISKAGFELHEHVAYELVIVEEGSMTMWVGGNELKLTSGEYIITLPKVTHYLASVSDDLKRFRLRFMPLSPLSAEGKSAEYIKGALPKEREGFIRAVISELRGGLPSAEDKLGLHMKKCQISVILDSVIGDISAIDIHVPSPADTKIRLTAQIEEYLYLNYAKKITLEELAEALSYSRTQMRRIIESNFETTFTDKLRQIRLSAAKRLLSEGKKSIDEIAESCGYETRQGFESMFFKFVGITPNQYRREKR